MATPLLPRWIVLRVSLHTVWYTGEYTIITLLMMGFADHAAYTSFARSIAYYYSVHGIAIRIIHSSQVMVICVSIAAFL